MNIQGAIDPGKAVMFAYVAISIGDVAVGFISQAFKSRKKAVLLFYAITAVAIIWFFNLKGQTASTLYIVAALLGFGTGFWAIFVTMAAEQFGTNIRATVATTVPNMVRGSLNLVSALFTSLQLSYGYLTSGWITGIVVMTIALLSLFFTEETYGKDLNYIETI
jgi:MFS family permease